jgi:hypothetical protein
VQSFLVEAYVPRAAMADVASFAERARVAAEALTLEGAAVRYLRSTFVPEDEVCFFAFEAASTDAVLAAADRASIVFDRVVEAVDAGEPGGDREARTDGAPGCGR